MDIHLLESERDGLFQDLVDREAERNIEELAPDQVHALGTAVLGIGQSVTQSRRLQERCLLPHVLRDVLQPEAGDLHPRDGSFASHTHVLETNAATASYPDLFLLDRDLGFHLLDVG